MYWGPALWSERWTRVADVKLICCWIGSQWRNFRAVVELVFERVTTRAREFLTRWRRWILREEMPVRMKLICICDLCMWYVICDLCMWSVICVFDMYLWSVYVMCDLYLLSVSVVCVCDLWTVICVCDLWSVLCDCNLWSVSLICFFKGWKLTHH